MKKKAISILLTAAMLGTMLTGCGGDDASNNASNSADTSTPAPAADTSSNTDTSAPAADTNTDAAVDTADEGKVLNVYCWNDEFKRRVEAHYPGYEPDAADASKGLIGDITVQWNITPNDDNAYQNNLDETLLKQDSAAADDKIDIFLIEADYALKYVDSDYSMALADLGISDADLGDQYQYTKDVVTDGNGVLKGASWQGCPGVMFYSREVAKEVLGTDDPDEVQTYVSDWNKFYETAATMKEAGYSMVSSVNDTYRVYSNNVSSKWVDGTTIHIDDNIMKWVEDSMAMVEAGQTGTHELWSDDWSKGFFPEGKVFAYFGPAWLVNFSMAAAEEGSIGYQGGWGAATGPQGFFWGGTWICAAKGTDNASTIRDIIMQLTANEEIMKDIVVDDDDFVNNKPAMEGMASGATMVKDENGNDVEYSSKILGGQNPLGMYCDGAGSIDLAYLSIYDQGCNEEFQSAMKNYFDGNATLDEALDLFYKAVIEKYPELTK
ncbi:MAG: carbohydrate ABC transporter substrate-binding protein [Lachnospiraceae bacterium]|nr:carbohydrate ABC transporter substrate-binding protein [Lachnospiraceae bacterium]